MSNYTFENFTVRDSNCAAYEKALAFANSNNSKLLIILGASGSGKTHLLHSIKNRINQNDPDVNVVITSTNNMTEKMIDMIKHQHTTNFRNLFSDADILLIEDIQCIAGKESTRKEVFDYISEIVDSGKRVAVTLTLTENDQRCVRLNMNMENHFWNNARITEQYKDYDLIRNFYNYVIDNTPEPLITGDKIYSFDNFEVNESNRQAYFKSMDFAQNNQGGSLCIFGGHSAGKTHLLNAAKNYIEENHRDKKVVLIDAEKFSTELISTVISRKSLELWRKQYLDADVLLVDDIQYLIGKETSLEEFIYIFNSLIENDKSIIMTTSGMSQIDLRDNRLCTRCFFGEHAVIGEI